MSHFTVLVIGENPEKQLAPFQENNMNDCPEEHLQFNDVTEEELKNYNEDGCDMVKSPAGELFYEWDEKFKVWDPENPFDSKKVIPEDYTRVEVKHKDRYKTFDEYMKDYCDREKDPKTGKYGYWENPNAKWDWYSLGGRWTGFFRKKLSAKVAAVGKPGLMTEPAREGYADQLKKKDIDFEYMRNEKANDAAQEYDYAMEILQQLPVNETWESIRKNGDTSKMDELRDKYWSQERCKAWTEASRKDRQNWPFGFNTSPDDFVMSKEKYVDNARKQAITTHAVIKDGKWYERGSMGWWAVVIDENDNWGEEFHKLLDSISEDTMLSVYDCHI